MDSSGLFSVALKHFNVFLLLDNLITKIMDNMFLYFLVLVTDITMYAI